MMVRQHLAQVRLVLAAGLLQRRIPGDEPALDLVQADLAAELHRLARSVGFCPNFFGEGGIDLLAEPVPLMPPPQPLGP
jgi:hypothetical protein